MKKNKRKIINIIINIIIYTFILIIFSKLFDNTIYVDKSYFGIYALLASIIIYILGKTIKPILVWISLPIIGLTLGLFYPFVNVIILYITNFVLGNHFNTTGVFMVFIVAILISLTNIIFDESINSLINKGEKNE